MLCGIPGSGKSTYAKELSQTENAIILSSDQLRLELFGDVNHQENNGELFQELYRRAKQFLNQGNNVIIDATNISQKRRIHFINEFKKFKKECIYLSTPYLNCVIRDYERDKKVGVQVIHRMYKQMQIPFKEEGWDEVKYVKSKINNDSCVKNIMENIITRHINYNSLFKHLNFFSCFRRIFELPHDSSYHSFSVSRHTYYVWEYILNHYNEKDKLVMLWTALLHDTGKADSKTFKEGSRYASFIGHENISSQLAFELLYDLGYELDFILQIVKLVQLHMRLLNGGENAEEKIKNMYGEDVLNKLKFFKEADTQAK